MFCAIHHICSLVCVLYRVVLTVIVCSVSYIISSLCSVMYCTDCYCVFCVIHHICPLVCVLYRIVLELWVQAVCEGAAGACPVGLPIVWLGPQARAQMMMGGRSEQATIQNLYSSEQATIQRYTVWWGVLSRQQYRTYTVWWGDLSRQQYSMGGRSEEGATLPRTGTSCQGFHNAGVPKHVTSNTTSTSQ